MSNLETLKQAIENQWRLQKDMLEASRDQANDNPKPDDISYYSGAVDALEEAMVDFDQDWVARLRSKITN